MTENLINILFRNVQVTLEKGFSMMDWIRLTKSGKDLTGVGGCRVNGKVREVRERFIEKKGKKNRQMSVLGR